MNDKARAVAVTTSLQSAVEEVHLFDALVAQIASGLLRVPDYDIDTEINLWLKRIGIILGLDRSTIHEINPLTGVANVTHGWTREPYRVISQPLDATTLLPWTVQKLLASETVVMASPDQLAEEASVDRQSFLRYGPKSNLIVPIRVGGTIIGAIGFASMRRERSWPADTVRAFQAIGEIFGSCLERKRAAAETVRLRNELSYVSRVTTMGELAAAIAHELNQSLAAILSNAEALQVMLTSEQPDLEEIRAGIADIIQDDTRTTETIRRVWALFRRGEVTKSKIDLGELLNEISRIVRTDALLRKISLAMDVKQPFRPVFGERVQLQQAIINLILNAFDAVSIIDGPREVRIEAGAAEGNNGVKILVHDSGKGIQPEDISRIFDPFFTTKPKGMGMGLAIAKSIIETHGGTLSVALNSYRGTTFEIRLPNAHRDLSL